MDNIVSSYLIESLLCDFDRRGLTLDQEDFLTLGIKYHNIRSFLQRIEF